MIQPSRVVWTVDALALVVLAWLMACMIWELQPQAADKPDTSHPVKVDGLYECETY